MHKVLLEGAEENWVPFRYNTIKEAMEFYHYKKELICYNFCYEPHSQCCKCPIFENLSTTTIIAVYPNEFGKPTMKFIANCCHGLDGTRIGCKSQDGLLAGYIVLWQAQHEATKS